MLQPLYNLIGRVLGRFPGWERWSDTTDRPVEVFDSGLQSERTALAWERTAISMMVAGILLARFASEGAHLLLALGGIAQTMFGGLVLVWTGRHYAELHGPLHRGDGVIHPTATRIVGLATIGFSGLALSVAVVLGIQGLL